ncbi:hypothetical protein [Campylobacter hyointestinalis]|uniref:hypothetical protein n=1 Tax=Campylobacter hyointestinalis TaxID=198 RepID=UPI000DCB2DB9|nr:hypothetical protein [Campylobacter hyointestinalis]RAZ61037.1 hypothetical protein CHL10071_03340 [Campylobacter hyointestinalis subsp. lawsonii]
MKKVFIFVTCVLFGIELYGGVWCNNDEGKSSVEQTNGTKNINSFGTDEEDIIELNNVGAYKFKLIGDNINTQHGINHWDQLSLRIKTGFASKISVKITKVYEYNNRYSDTIKGETDIRNIWFKFIKSNVTNYDKKERGGLCFNRMLNNVEVGGYAKFENGIAYLPKDDTANIIFEASNPQSDKYKKFKFEAEITVEPDDRKSSLGENGFLIVNDQFNKDGDSKNLYTQIVKRPFSVKLITNFNRDRVERDIASISITLHSKTSGDALTDAIEKIDLSKDTINELNNKKDYSLKIINLDSKFSVDNSKKKSIDYSNLYFIVRIYFFEDNPSNSIMQFKSSDTFAARPAKFNKRASFNKKDSLIGGKKYYPQTGDKNDFVLVEALDYKDNVIDDYNVILENQRLEFDRSANGTKNEDEFCTYYYDDNGIKTLQKIEPKSLENVWIKFSEGIGTIYTKCEDDLGNEKEFSQDNINNKSCYFVYPDIGHTKISITDNKTTIIDEEQDDCISGSSSSDPINGKIGCNVQLEEGFHTFIPSSIKLVKKEITNFYSSISYFSSNGNNFALDKDKFENLMSASLNLGFEARLADESVPKLYSANCYANSIEFSLKYDQNKDDQNIKFYGVKEKTDGAALRIDDKFVVDESEFNGGKSNTKVKFSLDKSSSPQNLVLVKNDKIRAENLTEGYLKDNKFEVIENGVNIIQNDKFDESYAKFFYGSLIVPDVFLDNLQNNKQIVTAYYSVFCDDKCISNMVESEENREIYRQTIEQVIGQTSSDKKKVPKNKGFYITEFMGEDIINTEYKPKDKEAKKDKEVKLDSRQFNKGVEQVEFSYSPSKFVAKAIEFTPYVIKDGVKTDTIATWLMEDEKKAGIFNVEFSTKSQWHGAGAEGKVMGIKDADESKARRQQRIDW